MKAQSAIEYLTTYGWMLVAVSIASGVVYTQLGGECVQSSSGFTGQDLVVEEFGTLSDGGLGIQVYNDRPENIEVENVSLSGSDKTVTNPVANGELKAGRSGSVEVPGVMESEQCNTLDVEFKYSIGGELTGQKASGTLRSNFKFEDVPSPAQPINLSAEYTGP